MSKVGELDKYDAALLSFADPVCLPHGVPWSQNPPHWAGKCLVCQLCFRVLNSTADCNSLGDGSYEDICITCASEERAQQELINQQ